MKKLTKILALILVCGAFMLTGCGLSLDVSGNYKEIDENVYTEYAENATYLVSGYEFEASWNVKIDSDEENYKTKGKVLYDAEGNITGMSCEVSATLKSGNEKGSVSAKYYIKDGKFYEEETENGKTTKTYRTQQSSDSNYVERFIVSKNLNRIVSDYASEVKYSKAEKSGYTKFKFEPKKYSDGVSGKCNIWVVFKDAKAYGLKEEIDVKIKEKDSEETQKLTSVSKQFNGKISYPSFDDFTAA